MRSPSDRSAALAITTFGAIINLFLAIHVLALRTSAKWDSESEWEGSADQWRLNGVKIVGGLLSVYFAAWAAVSFVGFMGIVNNKPSFVRFYRDSSVADFAFCTFLTIVGTFSAFRTCIRTGACEELSRHPDILRDMVEMGLNVENCELWFERAVLAFMAFLVILSVIRLHLLIAVSNYYRQITHLGLPLHTPNNTDSVQRIFLLPRRSASSPSPQQHPRQDDVLVYAPVPLSSLSPQVAHDLRSTATEAWISRDSHTAPSHLRSNSHSHSHRHRHHGSSGRISLPIRPDEGLLPPYDEEPKAPI